MQELKTLKKSAENRHLIMYIVTEYGFVCPLNVCEVLVHCMIVAVYTC